MINLLPSESSPKELAGFPLNQFPDSIVLAGEPGSAQSKTVCVVDGAAPEFVLGLAKGRTQTHVVQKNALMLATEVGVAAQMLADPAAFFLKPLETLYFKGAPSSVLQAKGGSLIKGTVEKDRILKEFENFGKPLPLKPQLLNSAITVLDEMVTNSCYNAPFAKQKQVVSRSLRIDLKKEEQANAYWAVSDEKMVVGVIDPFGALSVPDLITRLLKSHAQGMDSTLNKGHGGAGIGFRMIFDSAASLTVAVQAGRATAIFASFPMNVAPKNAQLDRKNLNFYFGK